MLGSSRYCAASAAQYLVYRIRSLVDPFAQQQAPPIKMDMTSEKLKVTEHYQYHTPDTLSPSTVVPSPFEQFRAWFAEAVESKKVQEPEAMVLATATPG